MANHMKMCSCRMCKYGRRKKWGKHILLSAVRANRRKVKAKLKDAAKIDPEDVEVDEAFSVPYTD